VSRTSIYRALSKDTTPAAVATGSQPAGTGGPVQPGTPGPGLGGLACGSRRPRLRPRAPAAGVLPWWRRPHRGPVKDRRRGRVGAEGSSPGARAADCRCSGAHLARRAAAQPRPRWYVVDVAGGDGSGAGGGDGGGAVVVLSAHGTQRAALTALARARRERGVRAERRAARAARVRVGGFRAGQQLQQELVVAGLGGPELVMDPAADRALQVMGAGERQHRPVPPVQAQRQQRQLPGHAAPDHEGGPCCSTDRPSSASHSSRRVICSPVRTCSPSPTGPPGTAASAPGGSVTTSGSRRCRWPSSHLRPAGLPRPQRRRASLPSGASPVHASPRADRSPHWIAAGKLVPGAAQRSRRGYVLTGTPPPLAGSAGTGRSCASP